MKRVAFAAILVFATGWLPALANLELAEKNACAACQAVDKKVVGPAHHDVATNHAGQKDALATVSESIPKGGSGLWGPVRMPEQPALSDANVKTFSPWVRGGAQ